ncbi:MAG: hypothetical protein ACYCW6_06740 [Candidatus Xenobia bacterium]
MAELRRRVLDKGEELYEVCDALGIPRAAGSTIVYWERLRREGKPLKRRRKAGEEPPPPVAATVPGPAEAVSLASIVVQLGALDLKTYLALPAETRAAIEHLLQSSQ